MLNLLSKIKIIDNTGAKSGIMIKRLKPKTIKSYASIGDVISFSVRKTINQNKVKRKKVYQAMIVRTRKKGNGIKLNRKNGNNLEIKNINQKLGGHSIIWDDNAAVLIKRDNTPIGTRIKGPICKSLRYKHLKIFSLKV